MTLWQLYSKTKETLEENNIEDAQFEALQMLLSVAETDRTTFLLNKNLSVSDEQNEAVLKMVSLRLDGKPLQYILGKWEFMGLNFFVGEGVLIPRPETEELCEIVLDRLEKNKKNVVFDLCAGSGCIGLSLKHFAENIDIYLIEKSPDAICYLEKNKMALGFGRTAVSVQGDILKGYDAFSFLPLPDVIVSNPPYIKTQDISALQKEVQLEPHMALDGGDDGFVFYRVLADKWLSKMRDGSIMAVECGEEQAQYICSLFMRYASSAQIIKDFNKTDRFVVAVK